MAHKTYRFSLTLLALAVALAACARQGPPEPTITPPAPILSATPYQSPTPSRTAPPTATATPTSSPTPAPSPTRTPKPTQTALPQPVSLNGVVFLSSKVKKPFATTVELRDKDNFGIIRKTVTDANGLFQMVDVQPGVVELWVLMTSKNAMIPGCYDVALPDSTWLAGILFNQGGAFSMKYPYLSQALLVYKSMPPSTDLKVVGIYAVDPNFEIKAGVENRAEVDLVCK